MKVLKEGWVVFPAQYVVTSRTRLIRDTADMAGRLLHDMLWDDSVLPGMESDKVFRIEVRIGYSDSKGSEIANSDPAVMLVLRNET